MGDAAFFNEDVFQTMAITPRVFPQMELMDIRGNRVNVSRLASSHHLILITLKNTTCPVCPQLLKILNMYGLDPACHEFIDPFTHQEFAIDPVRKRFFRLLLKHDAYFVVLCPGTNTQVGQIQVKTPFLDYPFISTQGGAVELVKALKVHLSDAEFMPAMLQVAPDSLAVDAIYIGRSPGHYFHQYLLKRLLEARCKLEMSGIVCLGHAHETANQLKRKIIKCQQGKMASNWMNVSTAPLPLQLNNNEAFDSHHRHRLDDLPSEILEIVLDCLSSDVPSFVKASRTSRKFYIAICHVLMTRIRRQVEFLKPALPLLQDNHQVVWEEAQVADESLDRWSESPDGVSYRELHMRVSDTRVLLNQTNEWTRHWSPRHSSKINSSSRNSNSNSNSRF